MKKFLTGLCILAAALCVLSLSGCDLFGEKVSVSDRMHDFISDANARAYSSLQGHTHPDADQYAQANDAFWDNCLSNYLPLTLEAVSGTTATVSGTSATFYFYLKEDDKDIYKIYSILRGSTTIFH